MNVAESDKHVEGYTPNGVVCFLVVVFCIIAFWVGVVVDAKYQESQMADNLVGVCHESFNIDTGKGVIVCDGEVVGYTPLDRVNVELGVCLDKLGGLDTGCCNELNNQELEYAALEDSLGLCEVSLSRCKDYCYLDVEVD